MICPNCSREILEGAVFCGFCGAPVSKAVSQPIQVNPNANMSVVNEKVIEVPQENKMVVGLPEENRNGIEVPEENTKFAVIKPAEKKKSKGRTFLRLLLLLLLLLSGGTLGYLAAEHETDIRRLFGETRMAWSESSEAYTEEVSAGNSAEEKEVLSEEQKSIEKAPEE
jgi:hypothetical protein